MKDLLNIDPNTIVTEGKLDPDMFEDPAMVFVDLFNEEVADAEEDLILGGKFDEMSLVDIVAADEPEFETLDKEETRIPVDDIVPQSQR